MNKKRQHTLIQYTNRLPPELIRYIKDYLPISVLKTVRKIQKHELPVKYSLCKDLNDHFYKKYIGFDIDIKMCKRSISMLQHKKDFFNPFSFDFWQTPITNDILIHKETEAKQKCIHLYQWLLVHYQTYHNQSTIHLTNYKIFEA